MKHRGLFRPRHVAVTDTRPPMVRLLSDCNNRYSGMIEVDYAEQWRTLGKAKRLGYVDDNQRLTPAGQSFLDRQTFSKE